MSTSRVPELYGNILKRSTRRWNIVTSYSCTMLLSGDPQKQIQLVGTSWDNELKLLCSGQTTALKTRWLRANPLPLRLMTSHPPRQSPGPNAESHRCRRRRCPKRRLSPQSQESGWPGRGNPIQLHQRCIGGHVVWGRGWEWLVWVRAGCEWLVTGLT